MKNKNKGKENIIGKIIYGFALFMPLLTILFTSLYTTFNKNAYQSYYGETINESQKQALTNNSQLINNPDIVYMENNYFLNTTLSGTLTYTNVHFETGTLTNQTEENIAFINNSNRLYFYRGTSIIFYNDTNNTSLVATGNGIVLSFNNITSTPQSDIYPAFYKWNYNKYSYLDNSFEYGIYKTENSNLYSWSKNTAIYSVLETTCQTLGIETTFIPFIFAYWLLISIIYILYDIALIGIHIVHKKIHGLEESI